MFYCNDYGTQHPETAQKSREPHGKMLTPVEEAVGSCGFLPPQDMANLIAEIRRGQNGVLPCICLRSRSPSPCTISIQPTAACMTT